MADAFPPRPEHSEVAQVDMTPTAQVPADQHPASPSMPPRDNSILLVPTLAPPIPLRQVPGMIEAFPLAQADIQADLVHRTSRRASLAPGHHVQPARANIPASIPVQTLIPSFPAVPMPSRRFPPISQSFPSAPQDT